MGRPDLRNHLKVNVLQDHSQGFLILGQGALPVEGIGCTMLSFNQERIAAKSSMASLSTQRAIPDQTAIRLERRWIGHRIPGYRVGPMVSRLCTINGCSIGDTSLEACVVLLPRHHHLRTVGRPELSRCGKDHKLRLLASAPNAPGDASEGCHQSTGMVVGLDTATAGLPIMTSGDDIKAMHGLNVVCSVY